MERRESVDIDPRDPTGSGRRREVGLQLREQALRVLKHRIMSGLENIHVCVIYSRLLE